MAGPRLERRRVAVFLVIAFGLSWATAGVLAATGGIANSPVVIGSIGLTLASVLLPTAYMWAPGLATLATRAITGDGFGWRATWLHHRIRTGWRYYLLGWFGPFVLTAAGAGAYFAAFPAQFDPTMRAFGEAIARQAEATGQPLPFDAGTLAAIQIVSALTIAPVINTAFALGEELGWRAYLLPKLLPLGRRRAVLASGVIWGVWHWPIVLMGHNYGLEYPGHPWLGPAAMVWFTVAAGAFLAWVTLRSGSVWPAAIGHASINAVAGLGLLFLAGDPNPVLGPTPAGVLGGLGFAVVAGWLLLRPERLRPVSEAPG